MNASRVRSNARYQGDIKIIHYNLCYIFPRLCSNMPIDIGRLQFQVTFQFFHKSPGHLFKHKLEKAIQKAPQRPQMASSN